MRAIKNRMINQFVRSFFFSFFVNENGQITFVVRLSPLTYNRVIGFSTKDTSKCELHIKLDSVILPWQAGLFIVFIT